MKNKSNSVFQNEYIKMCIEDGYSRVEYLPGITIDLKAAKIIVRDRLAFQKGVSYPALIDARNLKTVTKPAREYFDRGDGIKNIRGAAFLVTNAFTCLIITIFLKINKPKVVTKIFTIEQYAIDWLESFKDKKLN